MARPLSPLPSPLAAPLGSEAPSRREVFYGAGARWAAANPLGRAHSSTANFRETLDREKGERQRGVTAATPACEVTGNNLTRVRVGISAHACVGISAHACVRRMYEVTGCEVSYTWG